MFSTGLFYSRSLKTSQNAFTSLLILSIGHPSIGFPLKGSYFNICFRIGWKGGRGGVAAANSRQTPKGVVSLR